MIVRILVLMLLLSSCGTKEDRAINYNVHQRNMAEEKEKLEQVFLGKDKAFVEESCGKPKRREWDVTLDGVGYEERWDYDHRCAPLALRALDLNYRSQSFFFLNGEVAEIFVSVL
jgi:hypothetical protein